MSTWETYLTENRPRFLNELLDFLRIPSISALPDHADDIQRSARWVADRLQSAGIEGVCVLPTGNVRVCHCEWLSLYFGDAIVSVLTRPTVALGHDPAIRLLCDPRIPLW